MKSRKIITASLLFSFLASGLVSAFSIKQSVKEVKAIDINDYTQCDNEYNEKDNAGLFSALKSIVSPGTSGSYDALYTTYKSAYLKDNGKIFDYYSAFTNYDPDKDRAGSYKKEGDCFNREHSIPQSWWGGGTGKGTQGADPFIVVPTDGYVNNARSNNPFGFVKNASKTFSNSKSGTGDSLWGYTGTVFEPDDSVKGDFARIYFYSTIKYKAYNWTSEGNARVCFTGSESINHGLTEYSVKLFSYWSHLDPVSDWERHVNDAIAPIQKNRNPFIDHPEYADVLWGNVSGYTKYIEEAGVELSKSSVSLNEEETTTLTANSSDKSNITWTNSNPDVVSLSSSTSSSGSPITLTALSSGSATITASVTIDGELYNASCNVTVNEKPVRELSSLSLSGNYKTTFELGDSFSSEGLIVTAKYTIGEDKVLSADEYTLTAPDMSSIGNKNVNISYTEDGITKTTSYNINIIESVVHVESVSLNKTSLELQVREQVRLEATVLPVNAINKEVIWSSSDENIATVTFMGLVSAKSVGEVTITVTTVDGGLKATCAIKVSETKPSSQGCGGNIVATSVILSTLSALGIGLLLIKRKFSK